VHQRMAPTPAGAGGNPQAGAWHFRHVNEVGLERNARRGVQQLVAEFPDLRRLPIFAFLARPRLAFADPPVCRRIAWDVVRDPAGRRRPLRRPISA
jgi:hypothetical protein